MTTPAHTHRPSPLIALVVVPLLFAITVLTFAWPSARLEPRDLPIGLSGPATATDAIEQQLERDEGAFDVHRYVDEQAARDAIQDREIYGAIITSGGRPTLLTASAASPLVAGQLEAFFTSALAGPATEAPTAQVDDVVPADSDDPRGAVLSSLVLPLVLAGVVTAVIVSLLGRPGATQVGVLVGAAVLAALVGVLLVQTWLGAFGGPWLVNAGVLFLTMLAIASVITGLAALLGTPGIAIGALTMILLGNPWSGISSAPELLPTGIGLTGQLLPPGAGGNLLRSTAFFDDAGAAEPLTVLLVWSALGLTAIWAGTVLHRRREAASEQVAQPAVPNAG